MYNPHIATCSLNVDNNASDHEESVNSILLPGGGTVSDSEMGHVVTKSNFCAQMAQFVWNCRFVARSDGTFVSVMVAGPHSVAKEIFSCQGDTQTSPFLLWRNRSSQQGSATLD